MIGSEAFKTKIFSIGIWFLVRAVHSGGGGGGELEGAAAPASKTPLFSNIVFEFAELFHVAILVRNHKKIDKLTKTNLPST